MNLLRRTMEILGLVTPNTKGKKGRLARRQRSFRQRVYQQSRARHLLFEQVEDRRVLATVSAAAMVGTVTEGSPGVVYFNVSPPSMTPITVNYQTSGGTATQNVDYQGVTGSATIGPGMYFAMVSVNTFIDPVTESPETFSVTITGVTGATIGTPSTTITINDGTQGGGGGGGGGTVSVSALSSHYSEGTAAGFRVTRSMPGPSPVTVSYQTVAGTAIQNTDYQGTTGSVTIPANQSYADVSVATFNDFSAEQGETFSLQIMMATGATVNPSQNSAAVTIDDVAFVLPTISLTGGSVDENGLFTPTIIVDTGTAGTSYTYTIHWGDGSDGTYGTSDTPSHIYFDADPNVTVADIYNLVIAADWVLGPTATAIAGMVINTGGGVTTTSAIPRVAIAPTRDANTQQAVSPLELKEATNSNSGAGFVVMLLDGALSYNLTIPIKVQGQIPAPGGGTASAAIGFATLGADFTLSHDTSVTIPAGSTSVTISLAVLPDRFVEGPENAIVQLQYPNGMAAPFSITEGVATVAIRDNDHWEWTSPDSPTAEIDWVSIDPALGDYLGVVYSENGFEWADSTFEAVGAYDVDKDGLEVSMGSTWYWYEWQLPLTIQKHTDVLERDLKVGFEFDPLTGKIIPRNGSGVEGISQMNAATTDIAWQYSIDNSGPFLKSATVKFTVIAAVGGTVTKGNTGTVNAGGKFEPNGVGGSAGGSYSVSHVENTDGGGTAIDLTKEYTFTLESLE